MNMWKKNHRSESVTQVSTCTGHVSPAEADFTGNRRLSGGTAKQTREDFGRSE